MQSHSSAAFPLPPPAPPEAPERLPRASTNAPALTLLSQTPWVTPTEPWFNVSFGIGASEASVSGLHVSMTFYSRIDNGSQLQGAIGGTLDSAVLLRDADIPVRAPLALSRRRAA